MPEPEGATVQVNEVVARAPALSCAVTVTVLAPAVVGVPVIVPELEIEVPAGSPVAVKAGVWPLVVSVADTGTDTAVPAMPSCGPGLAMVLEFQYWRFRWVRRNETVWLAPGCRFARAKPSSCLGGSPDAAGSET